MLDQMPELVDVHPGDPGMDRRQNRQWAHSDLAQSFFTGSRRRRSAPCARPRACLPSPACGLEAGPGRQRLGPYHRTAAAPPYTLRGRPPHRRRRSAAGPHRFAALRVLRMGAGRSARTGQDDSSSLMPPAGALRHRGGHLAHHQLRQSQQPDSSASSPALIAGQSMIEERRPANVHAKPGLTLRPRPAAATR